MTYAGDPVCTHKLTPAELSALAYDHLFSDRGDIDFFVQLAVESEGPVLEVGCGTGRVLIPTARAGVEIWGIDRSVERIDLCARRLRRVGEVAAHVEVGDMRSLELDRRFALVTFPFRVFQHLRTPEDQLACLVRARRHLRSGGRVLVDVFNPSIPMLADERFTTPFNEQTVQLPGGCAVRHLDRIVGRDLHFQRQAAEEIFDVTHADGSTENVVVPYVTSFIFRYELEHLLARAGFRIDHVWADYDRRPYGATYPGDLIVLARSDAGP